jgi:hypothetical protein
VYETSFISKRSNFRVLDTLSPLLPHLRMEEKPYRVIAMEKVLLGQDTEKIKSFSTGTLFAQKGGKQRRPRRLRMPALPDEKEGFGYIVNP